MPFCDIISVNPAGGASVCGLSPRAWEPGIAGQRTPKKTPLIYLPRFVGAHGNSIRLRRLSRRAVFVKFQIINNIRCRHSALQRNEQLALANIYVMSLAHCCCRRCFEIRRQVRGGETCRLSYKFNQAWTDVQMKLPSPRRVPCVRGRLELRFLLYAFLLTIFRACLRRFVAVLLCRASRVSCGTRPRVSVLRNFVQSVESALWRRNLSFRGLTFFSLRV